MHSYGNKIFVVYHRFFIESNRMNLLKNWAFENDCIPRNLNIFFVICDQILYIVIIKFGLTECVNTTLTRLQLAFNLHYGNTYMYVYIMQLSVLK